MLKNGSYSAHELQRLRVQYDSLFGIWCDTAQTIELKISPRVGGAKIKVWTVNDFSAIEKIAMFCGLESLPKRTHWQGFDLITNLEKQGNDSYVNGIVNMPNNKRRNLAELKILEGKVAHLSFFYLATSKGHPIQKISGSIVLQKKSSEFHFKTEGVNIP